MPTELKLDKKIAAGTTYRAESDKYLVIEAVGTDSTSDPSYLEVDGKRCLEIYHKVAPLKKTSSNLLGLLKLGKHKVIVPPNKTFVFHGSASSYLRIVGKLGILAPGEVLPGDLQTRFNQQHIEYISYLYDTYDFSAGATVTADNEQTVIDWTCPVGEEWKFNNFLGAEAWLNDDSNSGDLLFKIYVEGAPRDNIETTMAPLGFTPGCAPFPPRDTVNEDPFIAEGLELNFIPGKSLKVTCSNPSALGSAAGKYWQYRVILVGVKKLTAF